MEAFDEDVLVIRRNRSLLAAAAVPAALGAALARAETSSAVVAGVVLVWLAMGLLIHVWKRNPVPAETPARAQADARGLFLDGRLLLEGSSIRGGWLQPGWCGLPLVRIRARGMARDVDLAVRDPASGLALLRALGVDPTRTAASYWVMARPLAGRRVLAAAVAAMGLVLTSVFVAGHRTPAALALAVVALAMLVVGTAAPTRVTVGADGVLVQWLGTTRFIRWARVADIEASGHGIVLALESGEWLTLRTPAPHEPHPSERDIVLERMTVAWRACTRRRPDDPVAALVRRAGTDTRVWVRAMRALSTAWNGYRSVGMPADRLWKVVENPAADRMCRTGAALALGASLDGTGKQRLLAAAASCAEPRLRIALETAAEATTTDDDVLAVALEAIESEGQDEEETEPSRS